MRRLSALPALRATLLLPLLTCTTGGTSVEAGSSPPTSPPATASVTALDLGPDVTAIRDPRVVVDGDGVVHLFWVDDANASLKNQVRHVEIADGSIGEPEVVSEAFDVVGGDPAVLVRATGEPCAFFEAFLDETDPSSYGFYMRCRTADGWSEPELVEQVGLTTSFEPAFDGSGAAFAVAVTPVSSITFEGRELSDDDDAIGGFQLSIDAADRFHVVWYELGDTFELNHRVSENEGATWSPIEAIEGTGFFVPTPSLLAASDGTVHVFYETASLFHRVWTADGGWDRLETGPGCGGDYAFALSADDAPVAACANISGVHLTTINDGAWTPLDTVDGSTNVPANAISLAVGGDDTRHVAWVTGSDPPELRYAAVPAG
jgi:hypothetical protein